MVGARSLAIVYFGTPAFAVPSLTTLIESSHRVVGLVSQPDRPKGRGQRVQPTPTKAVAVERGVPVFQPDRLKDPEFLERMAELRPDLAVVVAYGRILPESLLAVPRLGMINVHGSILPAYRGAAPVHRAVIAGDAETGVTIMRLIRELDAGPTLAMRRRPIGPDETSGEVEAALAGLGAELLLEVVDAIADGRAVETPQDDTRATFAPKLTKDEGRIDWNLPASTIHNLVRGLQPWPLTSTRLGSARLLIRRTRMLDDVTEDGSEPGTVVFAGPDGLNVRCGQGTLLRILEVQPEGGRAMSIRDYLAGHPVRAGQHLEPA
jgi:methionyl-tRNA formyltransferase